MQKRSLSLLALAATAGLGATLVALRSGPVEAVNTRTVVLDTAGDLLAGVLDRVVVTSDGSVQLGSDTRRIALDPTALGVWSLLDLGDGSALAGTSLDGRIYRIQNGAATLYAETGEVAVTSMARGEDGTLYAATLPAGRIYRILAPQNGRPRAPEVHVALPDTEHVWALHWDTARHALFAATGPQGKLFQVDRQGRATVVFDSDEPQLYSMAAGPGGVLYLGAGGGHAVVYAWRAPGDARAVARLAGDEVRALAVAGQELWAASNEFAEPPDPPRRTLAQSRAPTPGGVSTANRLRAGRGSLYRLRASGAVERVYYNENAHLTALEWDEAHHEVLAALGVNGRILAVGQDRTARLLFDVDETQVLALDLTGRAHLFGTNDSGAVYSVGTGAPQGASWTSRVLDGGTTSRWGALRWRGTGSLEWEARSGNSDPPDNTWSAWQAVGEGAAVSAPASRYAQLRARWRSDPTALLRAVTLYYLPINQRPVLTELTAEAKTGDPRPPVIRVGWKVENPDSDTLRYRVRFRGEQENLWRSVLRQGEYLAGGTSYDWSVEGLPEGFYRVQLEVSDEASNPEAETERDVRASEPVLVDNTAPRVTVSVQGGRLRGQAVDGASSILRVEWAVDTLDWRPLRAQDGVFDERDESFEGPLPALTDGGEHVLSVRAFDEAGNVGTATASFRAAGAARHP